MDAFKAYTKANRGKQKEIAEALGISQASVSKWARVPSERLFIVSQLTGIPIGELRPDIVPASKEAAK